VKVAEDGTFLIAFARTAPAKEVMTIHFADGSKVEHAFAVQQRTYETERIDGLPEDVVKLPPGERKEHAVIDARIDATRMKGTDGDCALKGFVWPARGRISSRWGQPRVLNGTDGGIHWGVDLAVPSGTPVVAPACGKVVFAQLDVPLSGGTMVIDHGRGVTSTFLHLSGFTAKVGDEVKKGDVVARSGATGRATGAHLDWRMNFFEVRIDPELLAPPMTGM
jgi:murein DD-endopeptidase MepM/ murein hydrolase activator NlpD